MPHFRASARALLLLAAAAAGACGKGTTAPSEPTLLVFTSGQNQQGQVGAALSAKVIVETRNERGPVANVTVAMAVESPGGGSVSPTSATTAADGTAQFTWTLGSKVGVQTLTASTTGQTPIHASTTATAGPGTASVVIPLSEAIQFTVVGHAVSSVPSVKVTDLFGNALAGEPVVFEALQGGNVLTGATATSDASGAATLGSWTIGPDALAYSLRARIPNGAVSVFEARGVPATVTAVAGNNQTANAGTALPITPAVRAARDDGSPLPNVTFNFSVTSGGGNIAGSSATTGADGIARPTRWVLGTLAGLNKMDVTTFGRPPLTFEATGTAATPSLVTATAGTSLGGVFGNYLAGAPEVTVTDALGNPVAGITVSFQVTQGGGRVTGAASQTDFLGRAGVTSWRLGTSGAQSVTATLAGLPPVVFNATGSAPPAGTFRIDVRYKPGTNPTAGQRAAFDAAAARWTQLILAGGAPYPIKPSEVDPSCGAIDGTIDGVVITAALEPIDGVGNILGAAGPCVVRDEGFLPVTGIMRFDTADLANLESAGTLNVVILHEMAHVLGFGTMWNFSAPGLGTNAFLVGSTTSDPTFNGLGARAAFFGSLTPGTTFTGVSVPVEGSFGPGTRLSHWRESSFLTELMTGFLGPGNIIPLSSITVQQFRDLGYVVDDVSSDNYTFQGQVQAAGLASLELVEGELPGLITVINRQGRAVAQVPRKSIFR